MLLTAGRLRLSFIVPVLLLRVRGAKTGKLRSVPLLYAPVQQQPRMVIVVGSNGGQESAPAWCANLRAHNRVDVLFADGWCTLQALELDGAERDQAMRQATQIYPGYAYYQARTRRVLPVFRLAEKVPANRE